MKNQIIKLVFATFVGIMMIGMVTNIEEDIASKRIVINDQFDYIYPSGNLLTDPPSPPPDWPPDWPPDNK